MHRRKRFLIYPPDYQPGDGYIIRYSKYQAWKSAIKLGAGSAIDIRIHIHPAPFKGWISSKGKHLWVIYDRKAIIPPGE